MAPPFQSCEFDILFGEGISRTGDVLDLGVEAGVVEKSGAWYSYQGERIGQGRENARSYLKEHPEMLERMEAQVLEKHGLGRTDAVAEATAEGASEHASAPDILSEPSKRPSRNRARA